MKQEIKLIRSSRKTLAIEIQPDLQIVVRAPYRMPEEEIWKFLSEKSEWIKKHLALMEKRSAEQKNSQQTQKISKEEVQALAEQALKVIPERVRYYAPIVGVDYGRITIRNQKTRWGSCSGKGNLNFNCMLMRAPLEVIDYVVVHELCHRLQMNHSPAFWKEVERVLPDYKQARAWLKECRILSYID